MKNEQADQSINVDYKQMLSLSFDEYRDLRICGKYSCERHNRVMSSLLEHALLMTDFRKRKNFVGRATNNSDDDGIASGESTIPDVVCRRREEIAPQA